MEEAKGVCPQDARWSAQREDDPRVTAIESDVHEERQIVCRWEVSGNRNSIETSHVRIAISCPPQSIM